MRKLFLLPIIALMMVGCSETHRTEIIKGNDGKDGISMGIDVSSSAPTCAAGGSTIRTYVDANSNSELDPGELIKQVAVVCNGVQGVAGAPGLDGTSVTVAVASSSDCPTGGITVNGSMHICNGAQGTMGPQGIAGLDGAQGPQGLQGIPGIDGIDGNDGAAGLSAYEIWLTTHPGQSEADFLASLVGPAGQNGNDGSDGASAYDIWLSNGNVGTQAQFLASLVGLTGPAGATGPQGPIGPQGVSGGVGNLTPVQLCPGDTATFKEFGFIVGTDLFAVYFDKSKPIAFLAKLNPGNYITTNGSGCTFNYSNNGTVLTLSNGSGTTTVNLTSTPPTPTPPVLAGSCSIVKYADYNNEQQFHFIVSGMVNYLSYTLEVTFGNASAINNFGDTNGGNEQFVSPVWTIAPQNSASSFDFYAKHPGNTVNKPYVTSAKVKKGGAEMTCTVQN